MGLAMSIHDELRAHLLEGIHTASPVDFSRTRQNRWSELFEKLMRNRLFFGACRYEGYSSELIDSGYDRVQGIRDALRRYSETGNLEELVNVANLAMLEFEHPSHPNPHFNSHDDAHHVPSKSR